ncbi:MAG: hypothetical protein V3V09_10605 [Arenicellales bacterium]
MNKRTLLKACWLTPIVSSIHLPAHAQTSPKMADALTQIYTRTHCGAAAHITHSSATSKVFTINNDIIIQSIEITNLSEWESFIAYGTINVKLYTNKPYPLEVSQSSHLIIEIYPKIFDPNTPELPAGGKISVYFHDGSQLIIPAPDCEK